MACEDRKEDQLIPYPEYLKLCDGWSAFFYDNETEDILLPILATLAGKKFYPAPDDIFRCFYLTPVDKLQMVIIGQDPYHNGSATGLCFDVKLGNQINPSLNNIYKELQNEGFFPTPDGDLSGWARQGVLLLNTALTVAPNDPESHLELWRPFFNHLMKFLFTRDDLVWILLGRKAIDYQKDIEEHHQTVVATHPSPLSAHKAAGKVPAFLGSNVFKDANRKARALGHREVVW